MKRILIAAIAALSFAPALAQDNSVTVSGYAPLGMGGYQPMVVKVSYADLDLGSAQGATTLLDRLNQAARLACGERMYRSWSAEHKRVFDTCRAQAVADAVKTIGAPELSRVAATH